MAALGTDAWLGEARDPAAATLREQAAAGAAEGPLRVQYVVTGTEVGEARWATVVHDDGSVEELVGTVEDPDVTLTWALADALAVVRGDRSANASWMAGRTKVVGHTGAMLRLLKASAGPAYDAARAELAARTD